MAFRAMCFKIFMGAMFNDSDCRTDSAVQSVILITFVRGVLRKRDRARDRARSRKMCERFALHNADADAIRMARTETIIACVYSERKHQIGTVM